MTNHLPCLYADRRESAVIEFLYGEADAGERSQFEQHLVSCAACRLEVDGLRGVRTVLAGWAPPEPMRALDHGSFEGPRAVASPAVIAPPGRRRSWLAGLAGGAAGTGTRLPAWAKVAAAVLCIGVGLGAANVQVTYSPAGVTVTTGWRSAPIAAAPSPLPWQADLTALEHSLREEVRALRASQAQAVSAVAVKNDATVDASTSTSAEAVNADVVIRQVKALIARSEQRQQNELALRLGGVLAEVQNQRRADLARIDRTIGVVQSNTGMEVLRQREMLNSLAVRVSTQR